MVHLVPGGIRVSRFVYDGWVINRGEEVNIECSAEMVIDGVEIENGPNQIDTGDKVEDDEMFVA